jgi:hypothetical protein
MQMKSKNSLLRRIRLPLSQATKVTAAKRASAAMAMSPPSRGFGRLISGFSILIGCAGMLSAQPSPVSVTPSSGSGGTQVFTVVVNDTNGGADISEVDMYVMSGVKPGSSSGWSAHECIVRYQRASGTVGLVVDGGGAFGVSVVSPGVASNSQCSIFGSGSSGTVSGNTLTVKFNITFDGSVFSGAKQIYLAAGNNAGQWSTNYQQQFGSWTIPALPAVPTPVSISPASGNSEAQTFTATFTDTNGASNIQQAEMYIMNNVVPGSVSGWSGHECIVRLDPGTNNMYLVVDGGGSYAGPVTLGSNSVVQNSQCTLAAFDSSKSLSGNTLTVNFAVFFNTTNFHGAKQLYLIGQNAAGDYSSNYQNQLASFTVPQLTQESCSISMSPNPTTLLSIDYYDETYDPPLLVQQSLGAADTTADSPAFACWQLAYAAVFTLPLELADVSGPTLVQGPNFETDFTWIDDGSRSCLDPDACYPFVAPGELAVAGIDVTTGALLNGNATIALTVFSSFIN